MKHAWIRYYSKNKWTIYEYSIERHESAISQIKNIEKSDFIIDSLYGLALTILPLFTRYDSIENEIVTIDHSTMNSLCKDIIKNKNVHACGGCIIDDKYQKSHEKWENEGKIILESYPGILLVWSLYKFTKK